MFATTLEYIKALNLRARDELVLVVDIETFFDPKNKISLRVMNYTEYGYHPDTDILMVGLTVWGEEGSHYQWIHDEPGAPPLRDWLLAFGYDLATVVCHNAFFDLFHINAKLGLKPGTALCTQCMASYLLGTPDNTAMYRNRAGGNNSLDSLGRMYVPQIRKTKEALADMQGVRAIYGTKNDAPMRDYLHRDVLITYGLAAQWVGKVPRMQRRLIHWAIRQLFDPVLELDSRVLVKILSDDMAKLHTMLAELGIAKTTLTSNQQFAAYLKEAFDIDAPMKISPATGKKTLALAKNDVAYQELKRYWSQQSFPTAQERDDSGSVCLAFQAREHAKSSINRTRAQSYLEVAKRTQGKWPVHIIPAGAHTNRPTGGPGGGGNPLNMSKKSDLRNGVCAPEGHYLLKFDYTGIELRLARAIARDTDSLEKIKNGVDLYCDTVGRLLNISPHRTHTNGPGGQSHYTHEYDLANITKEQRHMGKVLELSSQYGVGAARMHEALLTSGVIKHVNVPSLEDCKLITKKFRQEIHPALPRAWKALDEWIALSVKGGIHVNGAETQRSKFLRTEILDLPPAMTWHNNTITWPSGREMFYPHIHAKTDGDARGYAYKPRGNHGEDHFLYGAMLFENLAQSMTAEIIDAVQLEIEAAYPNGDIRVALQVYDELVLVVPDGMGRHAVKAWIQDLATRPPAWWPSCPELLIECSAGQNYGELVDV